jgi:hypothetical protein
MRPTITASDTAGRATLRVLDTAQPIDPLWRPTVGQLLAQPLWTPRDAYDAANSLMVPLHFALRGGRDDLRDEFDAFFERVGPELNGPRAVELPLQRMHFIVLLARYVALRHADTAPPSWLPGLARLLADEVIGRWTGGLAENVRRKLATSPSSRPSFRRALGDLQLSILMAGCDLASTRSLLSLAHRQALHGLTDATWAYIRDRWRLFPDGGGVPDPGAWADHPDYAYSGYVRRHARMSPSPRPGIAQDTSHAHRLPLALTIFAGAFATDSGRLALLRRANESLTRQFVGRVVVRSTSDFPAPRTTNYMDGWNGLFRVGYPTIGARDAVEPYELSGTLTLGWWSFLGTPEISGLYRELDAAFPLPGHVVAVYVGAPTSRDRNAIMRDPDCYRNGLRALVSRLAVVVSESLERG